MRELPEYSDDSDEQIRSGKVGTSQMYCTLKIKMEVFQILPGL